MPHEAGHVTIGAMVDLGVNEYQAFIDWYRGLFGEEAPIPPNEEGILDTPAYRRFVEEDRPGFVSLELLPPEEREKEAIRWTPPVAEEEPADPMWKLLGFGSEEEWRISTGLDLSPAQLAQAEATRWWREQQLEREARGEAFERERFEWEVAQPTDVALRQRLWEQQQAAEIAGLTAPADWITRWMQIRGLEKQQDVGRARRGIESIEDVLEEVFQTATPEEFAALEEKEWKLRGELEKVRGRKTGTPPTPEWLPQFAAGQVAGQPITKGRITTPSGQQWISTPWSVREGLRGFAEFSGFRPMGDILDQMAMMQPRRGGRVGGTQWQPAQQRV